MVRFSDKLLIRAFGRVIGVILIAGSFSAIISSYEAFGRKRQLLPYMTGDFSSELMLDTKSSKHSTSMLICPDFPTGSVGLAHACSVRSID